MGERYHPGVDDSYLCTEDYSAKHRSIIGCCIWMIISGIFDIAYATSITSRFNTIRREGYLKAVNWILFYLKTFSIAKGEDHHWYLILWPLLRTIQIGWSSIQMLEKKFQRIFLLKKRPSVRMIVYADADHAHDQITRRFVTGILVMINNTPIRWISKRQKIMETSNYGS
jgi:hypothetical protein